jgi:hypothetical protein
MASSPQKMVGCGRWRGSERHGDCPHPRPSPRLGIRILFSARGPRLPSLAPVAPAPGRGPRLRYLPALLPPSLHRVLLGSSGAAWFHSAWLIDRAIIIISDLPSPPFLVLQSTLAGSPTCQLSKFTLYFRQNYFGLYCAREKLN